MTDFAPRPGAPAALLPAGLAVGLLVPLFLFTGYGPLDFWWAMGLAVAVLVGAGLLIDRDYLRLVRTDFRAGAGRKILLGIASAAVLYGIFAAGSVLSRLIFPFAAGGIGKIYAFKTGAGTWRIAVLMAFVIGPGEEIFWRGFLQRIWEKRAGRWAAFLLMAGLYTGVHAVSGNPMLILAAAVCGLFWGALWLRYRSVFLLIVSHTLWDLVIFLLAPLGG